jgi:hypothetical protein
MIRTFVACAPAILAIACHVPRAGTSGAWKPITLNVTPVALGTERAAMLRFRGGLELDCEDPAFGGISGIVVRADGDFLAITDKGTWIAGHLKLDGEGTLQGIGDVAIAPVLDEYGKPLASKEEADTEGLTLFGAGRVAVSFERTQTVRLYPLGAGPWPGASAPGAAEPGPPLADTGDLVSNEGLESIAAFPDGTRLLIGSERGDERGARLWATANFASSEAPIAYLPLAPGFRLVGLDLLPDGDFVALERFYAPPKDVRIRLFRVDAESIAGGSDVHARLLAEFLPPLPLDNFEAISSAKMADGAIRIYLASDDNFSPAQRTLLYAFDLESP